MRHRRNREIDAAEAEKGADRFAEAEARMERREHRLSPPCFNDARRDIHRDVEEYGPEPHESETQRRNDASRKRHGESQRERRKEDSQKHERFAEKRHQPRTRPMNQNRRKNEGRDGAERKPEKDEAHFCNREPEPLADCGRPRDPGCHQKAARKEGGKERFARTEGSEGSFCCFSEHALSS